MDEFFVNPYTFVSLREGKTRITISPEDKLLTGKLGCTIYTKTPLAIPDLKNGTTPQGINKHPFFRINGKAVIPGSSIRGVIRNVYEALTNSCMHMNDKDDDYFSSRQNKSKAGLLEFDGKNYKLYEADRLMAIEYDSGLKTGDTVDYKPVSSNKKAKNVRKSSSGKGIFLRVDTFGNPPRQNHPSVFIKSKGICRILSREEINSFSVNIKRYEPKRNKNAAKQYSDCFAAMKNENALLPVWLCVKNGYCYLAPSQFSRTVFINKPKAMLERMDYSACTSRNDMCEACALFGMISSERGSTIASHVRFGDAVCEDKKCFDRYYVLPVLGSPRLSSFEFYLKSKNGEYTTVYKSGKRMFISVDPDEADTVLSGRKFY